MLGSQKWGQALKTHPLFLANKHHVKLLTARVLGTTQESSKALVFLSRTENSKTSQLLKATQAPKSTAYTPDNREVLFLGGHLYLSLGGRGQGQGELLKGHLVQDASELKRSRILCNFSTPNGSRYSALPGTQANQTARAKPGLPVSLTNELAVPNVLNTRQPKGQHTGHQSAR